MLKAELKTVTRKTAAIIFSERMGQVERNSTGMNYFRMASMQSKLKELDSWLHNRLSTAFRKTGRSLNGEERV